MREAVLQITDADVVMLLALGDVLGSLEETVTALRSCVKPGGFMVLDDAFLEASPGGGPEELARLEELEGCLTYAASRDAIENCGVAVMGEIRADSDDHHRWLQELTAKILARAESLAQERPEWEGALHAYAVRQIEETQLSLGPVVGVTWLLQRPAAATEGQA